MPERPRRAWPIAFGQGLLRLLVRGWLRVYHRWRVFNPPRRGGAYVLVANHASFLDPIVLGAACPRDISFLINATSYRSPLMRWFYRIYDSIPVDPRGRNREALRTARESLAAGAVIGVFPEGGITRDGGLLLGNPGAVALVLSSEVEVVPVGIRGTVRALPYGAVLPRPERIEIRFGDPIPAAELMVGDDRKARLAMATERIMREIGRLADLPCREDELRAQRQKL